MWPGGKARGFLLEPPCRAQIAKPLSFCNLTEDERQHGSRGDQLGRRGTMWPHHGPPETWNHRAVQGNPNEVLQPYLDSRGFLKWAEVLTRARPGFWDLAQRPPRRTDSASFKCGNHSLQSLCSGPAPSGFWFNVSPSAQGEDGEGRKEGGVIQGSGFPHPKPL